MELRARRAKGRKDTKESIAEKNNREMGWGGGRGEWWCFMWREGPTQRYSDGKPEEFSSQQNIGWVSFAYVHTQVRDGRQLWQKSRWSDVGSLEWDSEELGPYRLDKVESRKVFE